MRKRWILLGVAVATVVAVTAGIGLAVSRGPAAATSTGQGMVQACDAVHDSPAIERMHEQMPAALRAQCDSMQAQMDQMMGGQGMMGGLGMMAAVAWPITTPAPRPGGELTMMWGNGWEGWIFGALMMVLFWGGLVVLVVLAVRGRGGGQLRGSGESRGPEAKAILEERFARGEISKEEFEERRRVLEHAV